MAHEDFNSQEAVYRISMDDSLKDILLEIDRVFDNNHLYAYRNWKKGVVCKGPEMGRHWVKVSFRWDGDAKPDMDGAARLGKLDIITTPEYGMMEVKKPDYNLKEPGWEDKEPEYEDKEVFYVHMEIPRDFVADIEPPISDGLIKPPEEEEEIGDPEQPPEEDLADLPEPPEAEEEIPDGA